MITNYFSLECVTIIISKIISEALNNVNDINAMREVMKDKKRELVKLPKEKE